jgi:hypothetical protein
MRLIALLLCLAGTAALGAEPPDDATKLKIVEYMLKTPTEDASPAVIEPFLAIDPQTLPKKLQSKAYAKQLEVKTLLKLHDTKKKGSWLKPSEGCTADTFIKPTKEIPIYQSFGYAEVDQEDVDTVSKRTHCKEIEFGCQFSMIIFFDRDAKKPKPRRLFFMQTDPIMALIGAAHSHVGGGNYFGGGLSCAHDD